MIKGYTNMFICNLFIVVGVCVCMCVCLCACVGIYSLVQDKQGAVILTTKERQTTQGAWGSVSAEFWSQSGSNGVKSIAVNILASGGFHGKFI